MNPEQDKFNLNRKNPQQGGNDLVDQEEEDNLSSPTPSNQHNEKIGQKPSSTPMKENSVDQDEDEDEKNQIGNTPR